MRIALFDKVKFPRAAPLFQPLFSYDGVFHVIILLEVDQFVHAILFSKSIDYPFTMLPNSFDQVAGNSDV